MIKRISILSFITLLLAFASCEKCDKPQDVMDPFVNSNERGSETVPCSGGTGELVPGDIKDPNEEPDFDNIVDPDEDEDFDEDGK